METERGVTFLQKKGVLSKKEQYLKKKERTFWSKQRKY
jgi:hypothetical protein